MPILKEESQWYPEDLWELTRERSDEARWWCLHVKPRQEKKTARHLYDRGLSFYLPQAVRSGRTPSGRLIRSVIPLFPGYVFLLANRVERLAAFEAHTLVQTLDVVDQAAVERDLRQIRHVLSTGLEVRQEPTYPVGTMVRVTSGPLQGTVGIVDRRGKRDRFVAVVRALGQGASVVLEDWQVEEVPPVAT